MHVSMGAVASQLVMPTEVVREMGVIAFDAHDPGETADASRRIPQLLRNPVARYFRVGIRVC